MARRTGRVNVAVALTPRNLSPGPRYRNCEPTDSRDAATIGRRPLASRGLCTGIGTSGATLDAALAPPSVEEDLLLWSEMPRGQSQLVFDAISATLRQMNDECTRDAPYRRILYPEALRWYDPAYRRISKSGPGRKDCTEHVWSQRLAQMMQIPGCECVAQVPYPSWCSQLADGRSRGTCDLVVRRGSDFVLWLEIKGAWQLSYERASSSAPIRSRSNGCFQKHLNSPTEGALADLHKVAPLGRPEATAVGLLVIAFGTSKLLEDARHEFVREAGNALGLRGTLDDSPWISFRHSFHDLHYDEDVQPWMWTRSVER